VDNAIYVMLTLALVTVDEYTQGQLGAAFGAAVVSRPGDEAWRSDCDGRDQAELYEPLFEPGIGVALTRLKTPDDAVSFVQHYGLLSRSGGGLFDGERPTTSELSEPFIREFSKRLRTTYRGLWAVTSFGTR
jgi:hypothetical protein